MHPRTSATLDQLKGVAWFANVGRVDTDAADVLPDWVSAIASCSAPEWEDLCLEAANQFRERLQERCPGILGDWNARVSAVKPTVESLVDEKTAAVIAENQLPPVFVNTVEWDVLHLCMEAEFADVYPPGFYASQAYWYAGGHFPCGWKGAFPNGGRLVIF